MFTIIINNRFVSDENGFFGCPCCGKAYRLDHFRNEVSVREAGISGLCQKCQDEVFGED